jgi:hypothetical protein
MIATTGPIMVSVGDLLALICWATFPAIAWWRWYTNPRRPVKRRR